MVENSNNSSTSVDKVYQVVFTYRKKKDKVIIGPVTISAKNRRIALLKAALKEHKELLIADLLTIDVQVEPFGG